MRVLILTLLIGACFGVEELPKEMSAVPEIAAAFAARANADKACLEALSAFISRQKLAPIVAPKIADPKASEQKTLEAIATYNDSIKGLSGAHAFSQIGNAKNFISRYLAARALLPEQYRPALVSPAEKSP